MKKFNDNSNIAGNIITKYRENSKMSKAELSRKLELLGVNLDVTEIKRIEDGRQILKDFELIAFCIVLKINYKDLERIFE